MIRRTRWGFAIGVCLTHLILLRTCEAPASRVEPTPEQPALNVRLLPEPNPESVPDMAPVERRSTSARLPRPAPAREPITQAITIPAIGPMSPDNGPAAPADGAAASSPAPTASAPPLDLRLPPPALRGAGPASTRAEPKPRSVESQLSNDLADGPLREEALGNGRLRLRQGRRCVELRDARMAQIDPFNQSVSPIPKQGEDCSR
jgi:hypothetical protein